MELIRVEKLSLYLTVFLLLSVGAIGTAGARDDWDIGENRIENSDFEADPKGAGASRWTLEDGTCCNRGAEYHWEIDNEAHTGKRGLKIIGVKASGTGWHAKLRYENSSMEQGKKFTIAFWAKVDASEGEKRPMSTSVQMQHDPWVSYHSADIVLDSTEWKEYFDTFTASDIVDKDMWVGLSLADSDVDFWVDDFRFFEGEPRDEIGVEPDKFAVDPTDKLTGSWGKVKVNYR
jgi:hypothetical protein